MVDGIHYKSSNSTKQAPPAFVAYSPLAGGSLTNKYLDLYSKLIYYDSYVLNDANKNEFLKVRQKLKREIIDLKKKQRLSLFPGFYSRYASLKVLKYVKDLEIYAYDKFGIRINTLALGL